MIPMHVPGHKRNSGMLGVELPYGIDVTELPGFDNLHDMRGVLLDTAELAASLYGCQWAFPLVNGSTCGLLAAVRALTSRGDTVVMARNCHLSVYSAVELCGLKPVYITPETDGESGITRSVRPESVAGAIADNPGCALVIITSPTYEGVVSDVAAIAEAAHSRSIPLLVDEAHGAHLGFSDYFPAQAMREGADAAVVSLHKTLPALTQCALALVSGPFAEPGALRRELAVFQTSSPSYVLLASIDRCLRLLDARGGELFDAFEGRLRRFDARMEGLCRLRAVRRASGAAACGCDAGFYGLDPGKIVISARGAGLTGPGLAGLLRSEYRIETEMAAADYVVAVATVCDGDGHLDALADALLSIDERTGGSGQLTVDSGEMTVEGRDKRRAIQTSREARHNNCQLSTLNSQLISDSGQRTGDGELIALADAAGAVAMEHVWAYPPGIPVITAGEVISDAAVREARRLLASGVTLQSVSGALPYAVRARKS
jgi:arginine/lysine/ornithine decarboxylase